MIFVAAIAVATTVPSTAVTALAPHTAGEPSAASVYDTVDDRAALEPQRVIVGATAFPDQDAAGYDVVAAPPPLYSSTASLGTVALIQSDLIVWPVPDHSRVSSGFGGRSAPCGGCSTFHDGIDFTPGNGSPIVSIADGVVVASTEGGGGLGVMVEIQHNIDNQLVSSLYAHMQYGSRAVSVGETVTAGQVIGRVGSTGQSTGPHLHLEMFGADGVRFDGYGWLSARVSG